MKESKYTKEFLEKEIGECTSMRQALIKLGLSPDGGHKYLRLLLKEVLTAKGAYVGQAHMKNRRFIIIPDDKFFVKDSNRSTTKVRNALFKRGIKEKKCEKCKNTEWLGNPIPLEVHHIDGDKTNNELKNLRILCPNCHYFTDTYKNKNVKPL